MSRILEIKLTNPTFDLGQFSEVAYSAVSIEFLFQNVTTLTKPGFPLEGYDFLQDSVLVSSVKGLLGNLPAYVVYRPLKKQLVVAICGTSSLQVVFHDLRALRCSHPSSKGSVHSGFWDLYTGIKSLMLDAVRTGYQEHDVEELVITGHSMGGVISYLFCMDILSSDGNESFSFLPPNIRIKIAVFGVPRSGDANLVRYWRELVAKYHDLHGRDSLVEYSVKAFNDGGDSSLSMPLHTIQTIYDYRCACAPTLAVRLRTFCSRALLLRPIATIPDPCIGI